MYLNFIARNGKLIAIEADVDTQQDVEYRCGCVAWLSSVKAAGASTTWLD